MKPKYLCPRCNEGMTIVAWRTEFDRCHCGCCGYRGKVYQGRAQVTPHKKTAGSGVIAGRIEIGRGSNWKAGLV